MSMIDFIKRHEQVVNSYSGKDPLNEKLRQLQSMKPNYQKMATEIYAKVEKTGFFIEDDEIRIDDIVMGVGEFNARKHGIVDFDGIRGKVVSFGRHSYGVGIYMDGYYNNYSNYLVSGENLRKLKISEIATTLETRQEYNLFLEKIGSSLVLPAKRIFKYEDEVEIIEKPNSMRGWGYVKQISGIEVYVDFKERYFANSSEAAPGRMWVQKQNLRYSSAEIRQKNNKLRRIVSEVEKEFSFPEYENRKKELIKEASDIIEKQNASLIKFINNIKDDCYPEDLE